MTSIDVVAILRSYLERALKEIPGMKVLLLDNETTRIVSTVLSQSDILEQEVYLVERLDSDASGDQLPHLKAVAYLRPTRENIARLRRELREPRFGEYHIYFNNRLEDMRLQDLAEGDTKELVKCVHEAYGDFIALESHHMSIPLSRPSLAMAPMAWDYAGSSDTVARLTEGIAALALSLRLRFSIRYQRGSEVCQRLAQSLHHLTSREQRELFDFGTRKGESSPLLLIIDRRDDPVTPLLSQWTYQAMLHEILGIRDNRISLCNDHMNTTPRYYNSENEGEATSDVVVSPYQDHFYASTMYNNFGDVGMAVKGLVDAVSSDSKASNREFETLDDMAAFVEALPEMSAQRSATAKHVSLMSELSHAVERRSLMMISGTEQEIACQSSNISGHYEGVAGLVRNPSIHPRDKARLCALFSLRYSTVADGRQHVAALFAAAGDSGVDAGMLSTLRALLKHCGAENRVMDIFSDRSFTSRMATLAKQHLKGVENVYTQHVPPVMSVLEKVGKSKLSGVDYPYVNESSSYVDENVVHKAPKLVVLFIVGGTTYEEAKAVAELNAMSERGEGWSAGMKFLLGGTGVQNSRNFMEDMAELGMLEQYYAQSRGNAPGR